MKISTGTLAIAVPLAALLFGGGLPAVQAQVSRQQTALIGRLTQAAAIGGETTGWAVQTPQAQYEIDIPDRLREQAERYVDQQVRVRGAWATAHGPERGRRWVLRATTLERFDHPQIDRRRPDRVRRGPVQPQPPSYGYPPYYGRPQHRPYPGGYYRLPRTYYYQYHTNPPYWVWYNTW